MAGCCHDDHCSSPNALNSPQWRRVLWIALAINASMFLAEVAAGVAAGSASLQADAIDFLGDSANYAISLGVAGMALTWRGAGGPTQGMVARPPWGGRASLDRMACLRRHIAEGRDDGLGRHVGASCQWGRRADALPLPHRRREYALGLDLLSQRCDRQPRRARSGSRCLRHRNCVARSDCCSDHGRRQRRWRMADRAARPRRSTHIIPESSQRSTLKVGSRHPPDHMLRISADHRTGHLGAWS